jgi:uncharacterized protein YbjQ (UPF0145 family)
MDPLVFQFLIPLGVAGLFLMLGLVVGGARERAHLADLDRREAALRAMPVSDLRAYPGEVDPALPPTMITGEVVIASDALKTWLASLRKIIGGELRGFERLLARARREAVLRVMEEAARQGYGGVCCLRLDTSDIGGNASNPGQGTPMAVVLASATAFRLRP